MFSLKTATVLFLCYWIQEKMKEILCKKIALPNVCSYHPYGYHFTDKVNMELLTILHVKVVT